MSINEKILSENMRNEIANDLLCEDLNELDHVLGIHESEGEDDLTDEEFEAEIQRLEDEEDSIECDEDEECDRDLDDYLDGKLDEDEDGEPELNDDSEDNEGDDDIINTDIYEESSKSSWFAESEKESDDENESEEDESEEDESEEDESEEDEEEEVKKESSWFN